MAIYTGEVLTPELSDELCNTVFPEEIKEVLKISLPAGREISLSKQFHSHYRNRILQYSKDDAITEMAIIYEYSKQEIKKLQLYKSKLDSINSPESFFLTKLNNVSNTDTNNSMNTENLTNNKETKTLSLSRGDSENSTVNKSLVRTGNSAFNEDFSELESNWDKRDKSLEDSSRGRDLLDIKTDGVSLDSVSVSVSEEKKLLQETEAVPSEVAYTNVALNKSIVNNKSGVVNTSKNFNSAKDLTTTNKNALTTGISNKSLKSIQLEFTYNKATIEAFNTYIADFRESFLNSFSSLFVPCWTGYGW